MKKENPKICPFMSNADKQVECTRDCALSKPDPIIPKCAFFQIVEAIDHLSDEVKDFALFHSDADEE